MVQLVDFLFYLIKNAATLYFFAIFIYIIMSWIGGRDSTFGQILGKVVEPYLEMFRSFIPPLGMIDLSPIVAIMVLRFATMGLDGLHQMVLSWL